MFIGIVWGDNKIEGIALAADGSEVARLREATPRHDYAACLKTIRRIVERIERETGQRGSLGIGIPGSLDPLSRLGKRARSPLLLGKPVEKDLQDIFAERSIRIENDADCFAASEAADGAGKGYNVVFAVVLGSGAGAGVATGGRAHHGPNNSAGEWGHNPLPYPDVAETPGALCHCGRYGCMETWVSGRAFESEHHHRTGEDLKADAIIARKRDGDRICAKIWDRYIDRLARGLSVVVNTLDPDIFVMGGGMANIAELYADLPAAIGKYTFSTAFQTPVVSAKHGDASGVRGAAWLWKD